MDTKVLSTKASPLGERRMLFTISTGDQDRDNDTIDPKGWDLKAFKLNPVVLWSHNHALPPVGRAGNIWNDYRGLLAEVEFTPAGMSEFNDMIYNMCKGGFLNCTSVGFKPIKSTPNGRGGYAISQAELLEFSIVSIPANPSALIQQRSESADAINKWFGDSSIEIDLASIGRSMEQIDLTSLQFEKLGIEVTDEMVAEICEDFKLMVVAGARAGLKVKAQLAARQAIEYMTGKLP